MGERNPRLSQLPDGIKNFVGTFSGFMASIRLSGELKSELLRRSCTRNDSRMKSVQHLSIAVLIATILAALISQGSDQQSPSGADSIVELDERDAIDASGSVAPIDLGEFTGSAAFADGHSNPLVHGGPPDFSHDDNAEFHGHGEQVCASGCAVSRHPTDLLTKQKYFDLLNRLRQKNQDDEQSSLLSTEDSRLALDTLAFYGRQTNSMMKRFGVGGLPGDHAELLKRAMRHTHVMVAIRVTDESGAVRSWLDPTRVPLDRRHVFSMKTHRLQPLVTSGTVKRVGLDHLWTRL